MWLLTRWRPALDIGFYLGLYAYASFSYPQQIQPVDNVLGWSFWINHAVTLVLPVFVWLTEGWRPSIPALWRAYGWFLVYYAVALAANAVTGRNYFYLRDRPIMADWPDWAYLPGAALVTLALFWVGYGGARLIGEWTGTWGQGVSAASRPSGGIRECHGHHTGRPMS